MDGEQPGPATGEVIHQTTATPGEPALDAPAGIPGMDMLQPAALAQQAQMAQMLQDMAASMGEEPRAQADPSPPEPRQPATTTPTGLNAGQQPPAPWLAQTMPAQPAPAPTADEPAPVESAAPRAEVPTAPSAQPLAEPETPVESPEQPSTMPQTPVESPEQSSVSPAGSGAGRTDAPAAGAPDGIAPDPAEMQAPSLEPADPDPLAQAPIPPVTAAEQQAPMSAPEPPVQAAGPLPDTPESVTSAPDTPDPVEPDPAEPDPIEPGPVAPDPDPLESVAPDPVTQESVAPDAAVPVSIPPSPRFAEQAHDLLDIMGMPDCAAQPQERALAANSLLPLIGHLPPRVHKEITNRLCLMEKPPVSLVRAILKLGDARLEEQILLDARLSDRFLLEIIDREDQARLDLISRRRNLTEAACAAIVRHGNSAVIAQLLHNTCARLDEVTFWRIEQKAMNDPALHAPLATHKHLPAAVGLAAFWYLPPNLRRHVMSRFLVDSGALARILRIALPDKPPVDKADRLLRLETMIELIVEGDPAGAIAKMIRLTGIDETACTRIVQDASGEAMTALLKALGQDRADFTRAIQRMAESPASAIDRDRDLGELENTFATLSHNKAWMLLLYWHWQARGIGPYAS